MELGISTYTYGWAVEAATTGQLASASVMAMAGASPERPFDERVLVRRAISMGLTLIQVGDNLPLHCFSPERRGAFKALLRQHHITLEVGARGLSEEHLQLYIGICREMGASVLRFVTDEGDYRPSVDSVIGLIRTHLPLLERNQVVLAIENHDRLKVKELARIMDAVDSPFAGVCLDSVNSLGAGEGVEAVVEVLAPYTVNLHIKDFGIERLWHRQGFLVEGRIAGEGQLDIPCLVERVRSYHRCKTCVLEQWVPPESEAARTLAKEESWAEKGVNYLKKIIYDKNFVGGGRGQDGLQADR